MNVFEFLGLPANHRADEKITHKVKNRHEVPVAKVKYPAIAQCKEDGVSAICVITAFDVGIFTRTGKRMTNVSHIEEVLFEATNDKPNLINTVIFAELCNPLFSLEELSGAVNPNRTNPLEPDIAGLIDCNYLVAFDFLTIAEFISGKSQLGYERRWVDFISNAPSCIYKAATHLVEGEKEFERLCDTFISEGKEGAVLKQLDFIWQAGKKDYCQVKQVRGVDYDLEVTDVETGKAGTKREGQVTNLVVRWRTGGTVDGSVRLLPVDGCFSDSDRVAWCDNPSSIVGRIVHVHALQISSKGLLRLPKVKSVRIDKTVADL